MTNRGHRGGEIDLTFVISDRADLEMSSDDPLNFTQRRLVNRIGIDVQWNTARNEPLRERIQKEMSIREPTSTTVE